jgi:iron complex transport system substrate-binding protein
MKKRTLLLLLALMPAILFAQPATETQTVGDRLLSAVDANGRTVTVDSQPMQVTIAGRAANMPANALFLFPEVNSMELSVPKTDQGLGDFFALVRPSLNQKPRLSQQAGAEELAASNPDLILTKTSNYERICKQLDQFGIPNFTMNLETYEDWLSEIPQLGKLLGNPERAEEILSLYADRLDPIVEQVATLDEGNRRRVLFLQGVNSDNATSFKIAPDSWMQTWMAEQVGAVPVWKGATKATDGWSTVSFEQIAAWNPDTIYIISYKTPTAPFVEEIYDSPVWAGLDAVKNHRVLQTPADMMSYFQPIASWILGIQWMALDLYPQLFQTTDMTAEVVSFYHDFYGITDQGLIDQLVDAFEASTALNRQ